MEKVQEFRPPEYEVEDLGGYVEDVRMALDKAEEAMLTCLGKATYLVGRPGEPPDYAVAVERVTREGLETLRELQRRLRLDEEV